MLYSRSQAWQVDEIPEGHGDPMESSLKFSPLSARRLPLRSGPKKRVDTSRGAEEKRRGEAGADLQVKKLSR